MELFISDCLRFCAQIGLDFKIIYLDFFNCFAYLYPNFKEWEHKFLSIMDNKLFDKLFILWI